MLFQLFVTEKGFPMLRLLSVAVLGFASASGAFDGPAASACARTTNTGTNSGSDTRQSGLCQRTFCSGG